MDTYVLYRHRDQIHSLRKRKKKKKKKGKRKKSKKKKEKKSIKVSLRITGFFTNHLAILFENSGNAVKIQHTFQQHSS